MGYQIKNSNQFESWSSGSYLTPSDLLVGKPGSNLSDKQSDDISGSMQINVTFRLRRNTFENTKKPKEFVDSERILNLSYKKQARYINSLGDEEVRRWYGASSDDLDAARNYLLQHNATIEEEDQEQRYINATLSLDNFRSAFLAEKPQVIFNEDGSLYYYNPNNYADSYLEATGQMGEHFANAVIGVEIVDYSTSSAEPSADQAEGPSLRQAGKDNHFDFSGTDWGYYPNEIAELYNFPSLEQTRGGKGITIGLLGSGGNQFNNLLNQNSAFSRYLKEQGIHTKGLGRVISPNDPEDFENPEWYGESAMDYSILRSIAPYADIKVSENSTLYNRYAELIYDGDVDIISSSLGILPYPGFINQKDSYHELFVDAVLRGKPVVVSAGDQGTANTDSILVPEGWPIPNFSSGDSAVLSVGGTAFSKKVQERTGARPEIIRPTTFPPSYGKKTIDSITGLIDSQLTWNNYSTTRIRHIGSGIEIYPSATDSFAIEDFVGAVELEGFFENAAASSGAFSPDTIALPAYQQRNLKTRWKGTGRRYPDIAVLAGGNRQENISSNYYTFTAMPNEDQTAYEPVIQPAGGGTSAGAPLITGLLARIGARIKDQFGKDKKIGFVNPILYESYNSKRKNKVLIDVPAGSNNASVYTIATSPESWSGYAVVYRPDAETAYLIPVNGTGPDGQLDTNLSNTAKGFDAATGLGSINGQGLMEEMTRVFTQI